MTRKPKSKTLSPQLPGRGGEGMAILSGDAKKSITYERILQDARRAGIYRDQAGDVAHEAWLLVFDPEYGRGYYCRQQLSEAARNLRIWRIGREEEIADDIPAGYDDMPRRQEQQERIAEAVRYASPQIQQAVALMIEEGMDMGEAADEVGLTPVSFSRALAALGRKLGGGRKPTPVQDLPLFLAGGGAT